MKTIINKILPLSLALTSLFFILVESQFKNLTESVSAPCQIYFHDPETPIMEGIINFHDKAMCLITFIVFAVGYFIFRFVFFFKNTNDNRLYFQKITKSVAILPLLIILNSGVPFLVLLEGTKGNASQDAIVKVVVKDSYFLDNMTSSGFLPEFKCFLISNIAFVVPLFLCSLKFYTYYNNKPKPPSDPESGSEGVVLDTVEARTADLLGYSGDSSSSGSDSASVNDLGEEVNSSNPIPRFHYPSEVLGEEEKSSNLSLDDYLDNLDSSSSDFESNLYLCDLWEDKLCAILDAVSDEKRILLIRELLENSDSLVQVTMIVELINFHLLSFSYISYRDRLEGLSHALTFCNDFSKSNPFLDDDTLFVETFTNYFLIVA